MHPRGLDRDAQALYWYMKALGLPAIEVLKAEWDSGIPEDAIYKAIRRYPELWELDGTAVRWTRSPTSGRAQRLRPSRK